MTNIIYDFISALNRNVLDTVATLVEACPAAVLGTGRRPEHHLRLGAGEPMRHRIVAAVAAALLAGACGGQAAHSEPAGEAKQVELGPDYHNGRWWIGDKPFSNHECPEEDSCYPYRVGYTGEWLALRSDDYGDRPQGVECDTFTTPDEVQCVDGATGAVLSTYPVNP